MTIADTLRWGLYGGKQRKAAQSAERPDFYDRYSSSQIAVELDENKRQVLAWNCAYFYANIGLLARKLGSARLHVLERTGENQKEQIDDHPFEMLFRRPNHLLSGAHLMQYTMAWLGLHGSGVWYLGIVGDELREIWPLPAREVFALPDKQNVIGGYVWRRGSKETTYSVEQICHFQLVNPFSMLTGQGFIDALRFVVEGNTERQRWNANFFGKKRAIPEAVASVPSNVSNDDFDRLREEAEAEFGGGKRSILWTRGDGSINVQRLGMTHEDMDFLAGMEYDGKIIDRVCGFPEGYWSMKANRANAEQAERALARDMLQPTLSMFAGAIEAQIIDRFYEDAGKNLVCEFDNVVPEDRSLKVREFQTYSRVKTINEARVELGLNELDDERGDLLVSETLASRSADLMGEPVPTGLENEAQQKAIRDELAIWRKVAQKEAAKGHDPGAREFVSDVIPEAVKSDIELALMGLVDSDAIAELFEPYVNGNAARWRGYP